MSLKAETLTAIELGDWILAPLAKTFQSSLSQKLAQVDHLPTSLNHLTLAYYGYVESFQQLNGLSDFRYFDPRMATESLRTIFEKLVQATFGNGSHLKRFSETEIRALETSELELRRAWPEISAPLSHLTLFVRAGDVSVLGASVPRSFGTFYYGDLLANVSSEELVISLAHELAHHELFLINLIDRLIVPEADQSLQYAPLQKRERPPIGRLHAFYALHRMIQGRRRLGQSVTADVELLLAAQKSFVKGELSPYGEALVTRAMKNAMAC